MKTWYGGLLGGLLPILLLGFGTSAVADRIAFLVWALALGIAWTATLRQGLETGLPGPRLAGILLLLLAAGGAAFAWLEARHHESLDQGFRALLPGLYHPALTAPWTAGLLAAILATAGVTGVALSLRRKEIR